MQKAFYLILFTFILQLTLQGQNNTISGYLKDQLNSLPVANASISIVRDRDSLLMGFSRTDYKGYYSISGVDTGKMNIFYSYPGFLINSDEITVAGKNSKIFRDTAILYKQDMLLNEVTIIDQSTIKIKGDTIEFKADSFKVSKNANAEDLLKKLPGIQVNSKGEIKAMGETVQKVYVDGDEFFGTDPTIATKNIQAKAVDKVQVFDQKSEQSQLTGLDDGQKMKVINLQLKENYKKGYFGKINATAGLKPFYYDESILAQYYKGNAKYALYGILSNTGSVNLSFRDSREYMGNNNNVSFADGMMMVTYNSSDDDLSWDGQYNGKGKPEAKALGGSYSNKFFKNKLKINLNYGYSDRSIDLTQHSYTQQFLPNSFLNNYDSLSQVKTNNKHSGQAKITYDIDSSTTLDYTFNYSLANMGGTSSYHQANENNENKLLSEVKRNNSLEGDETKWSNRLFIQKKYKKKDRSTSLNAYYARNESTDTSYLYSVNNFYAQNSYSIWKQLREDKLNTNTITASLYHTEPLNDKFKVTLSAVTSINDQATARSSYEFDYELKLYNQFVDSLSNNFTYHTIDNNATAAINYKNDKWNAGLGGEFHNIRYNLANILTNTTQKYHNNRWVPQVFASYNFTRSERMYINYRGTVTPPDITQIQPLQDNSNPLQVTVGNPDLKQKYNQNISLSYNKWEMLSGNSIWGNLSFSNTFNDIIPTSYIDISGRNTTTYINADGNYNAYMYTDFNFKLNKEIEYGIGINANYSNNVSYINNYKTIIKNSSLGPNVNFSWEREDKIEFEIRYSPDWNFTRGGIIQNKIQYYSHELSGNVKYFITKKLSINSDVNYIQQNPQNTYDKEFKQILWNASLSYNLLKNENLQLKLGVKDILNQNKGFNRYSGTQSISETTYNTIQRYSYLSVVYNFRNTIKNEN